MDRNAFTLEGEITEIDMKGEVKKIKVKPASGKEQYIKLHNSTNFVKNKKPSDVSQLAVGKKIKIDASNKKGKTIEIVAPTPSPSPSPTPRPKESQER